MSKRLAPVRRRRLRSAPPRAGAAGAATVLLFSLLSVTPSTSMASAADDYSVSQMRGKAHGGNVNLAAPEGLGSVLVGDIAPQSLPCNPTLNFEHVKEEGDGVSSQLNFLDSIVVPNPENGVILQSRHIRNSGGAQADALHAEVHERSRSADVFLLGGLVTADVVQADAHSVLDDRGVRNPTDGYAADQDTATGTMLYKLKINGEQVGQSELQFPQANYVVPLPAALQSVMRIVLNEQRPFSRWIEEGGKKKKVLEGIDVNAMHVYVLDYQGYTGDILIGHAATRLAKSSARISGYAYGSRGTVDPFLASGKTALLGMPCGGTAGELRTRSIAGATVLHPDGRVLMREGTVVSTVQGLVSPSAAYSRTSSTTEDARLLLDANGSPRILVEALRTRAATESADGVNSRAGETTFARLVIDGTEIASPSPEPNTTYALPGVGRLVVNRQMCANSKDDPSTPDVDEGAAQTTKCDADPTALDYLSLTVIGLQLFVDEQNMFDLPVGAQVLLSVSHADISSPVR
jgi:hypothetical protein